MVLKQIDTNTIGNGKEKKRELFCDKNLCIVWIVHRIYTYNMWKCVCVRINRLTYNTMCEVSQL